MENTAIKSVKNPVCSVHLCSLLDKLGYQGDYTHGNVNEWLYENFDYFIVVLPDSQSRMKDYERIFSVAVYRYIMNLNVQVDIIRKDKKIATFMNHHKAMEYAINDILTELSNTTKS